MFAPISQECKWKGGLNRTEVVETLPDGETKIVQTFDTQSIIGLIIW